MNERREKIVAGILGFAIMIAAFPISLGIVRLCASVFAKPDPHPYHWITVYVSQSPNAQCYHRKKDCEGLQHTRYDIVDMFIDEAEELGKRPCEYCMEEDRRHRYDDAADWIYWPVVILMFMPIVIYDRVQASKKSQKYGTRLKKRQIKKCVHKDGLIYPAMLHDDSSERSKGTNRIRRVYIIDGKVCMLEDDDPRKYRGTRVDYISSSRTILIYDPEEKSKEEIDPAGYIKGITHLDQTFIPGAPSDYKTNMKLIIRNEGKDKIATVLGRMEYDENKQEFIKHIINEEYGKYIWYVFNEYQEERHDIKEILDRKVIGYRNTDTDYYKANSNEGN